MAFSTFLIEGISLASIVNSTVCRMLHACLHSVIFSQLTVSKYRTINIGLQESCKPAKVALFKALNGSIGFWRCVVTAIAQGWCGLWWCGPMWYLFMGPKIPGAPLVGSLSCWQWPNAPWKVLEMTQIDWPSCLKVMMDCHFSLLIWTVLVI